MSEILPTETAEAPPAPDPIREIEQLRAANRRWRKAAIGTAVAFVFLFVLSLVQFLGTFITCRLLHEARQEAARARQDTMKAAAEIKEAERDLRQTREAVAQYLAQEKVKARTDIEEAKLRMGAIDAELMEIEANLTTLAAKTDKNQVERLSEQWLNKQKSNLLTERTKLKGTIDFLQSQKETLGRSAR